jgi:hypothetical protein
VAKTTVKRLLSCGFRRTGKAMGASVSMLMEKYMFFRLEISHVLHSFVTCLLILPRKKRTWHPGEILV